jgi:membrane protease YdiL (CAAX protease family)
MITDWLTDPDRAILGCPVTALLAALILALTRRHWSPRHPRARVGRALVLCACMAGPMAVNWLVAGGSFEGIALGILPMDGRSPLYAVAYVLGGGLLLGWLIPCGIEGRSLREMGWVRRRWPVYLLLGTAAGLAMGCVFGPKMGTADLPPGILPEATGLGIILMAGPRVIGACLLMGIVTGWMEENVVRGHLMTSLQEAGLRPRSAWLLQAVVFALYHLPKAFTNPKLASAELPVGLGLVVGGFGGIFLWGLLFGWLRQRTGSLVPGFALHSLYDATRFLIAFAPYAAIINGIRS